MTTNDKIKLIQGATMSTHTMDKSNKICLATNQTENANDTQQGYYVEIFKIFMSTKGFPPPENIIADGKFHCFQIEGDFYSDIWWYILSTDVPALGLFGCFDWQKHFIKYFNNETDLEKDASSVKKNLMSEQINGAYARRAKKISNSFDIAIARLAKLHPFDYCQIRKDEAEKMKVLLVTVDKVVNEKQRVNLCNLGPQLLPDILDIFCDMNMSQLSTDALITALCVDKEKPWATCRNGYNISDQQLALILKQYFVKSRNIRFKGLAVRGYTKESISEAFSRFVTNPVAQSQHFDTHTEQ